MVKQVIGSKGGGGGSSFVTKPDTLRSNDSFEILLGLGSGRWKGLTDGLPSLKINGVPMQNDDGTSNFEDVYAIFADGNPLEDQIVTFRLGGGGSTQSVNTALTNLNTGSPGPWVSAAVSTPNANFIDLRFIVSSLFYQDSKGIRENTANIEIELRPTGAGTWTNPFAAPISNTTVYDQGGYEFFDDYSLSNLRLYLGRSMFNPSGTGFRASSSLYLPIKGKTSSPFVKEMRIAVPNTGTYANKTWEVRARLLEKDTVDNDDIQERRAITFESVAAVINEPLGDDPEWDGLVWLQLHGKASDQFSGFPSIEGVFDTKICKTPPTTVFDPDARTYTAVTWDGSYEQHFTTDPAWQIKEFVEDPEHGIAGLYPGATLDKWDALEASKYYSELVDDGNGGTHPRFSMNLTINEAKDIDEMMGFLAGAVNSYTEDVGGGVWRLKVDKPETPVMLFTEDNIFGDFQYSHSDVDTRFNDWRGTFRDENLDYQTNTVRVFDQSNIDDNGIKFTEVALIGCTNAQEALRRLMFRMRVSLNEYKVVTFTTNRVGRYLSPLDTILVADGGLNTDHLVKSTSRMESHAGTTVTLKRPLRLEVGVNYTINFSTSDEVVITRNVTNTSGQRGDVTEVYIDSALPATVLEDSAVALQANLLPANPLSYRILSVERADDNEDEYTITASIIDAGKWNAMDNVSQADLLAQESNISIDAPTVPVDGMFNLVNYSTTYEKKVVLQVNWNRPAGLFFQDYKVEYRLNDGQWIIGAESLTDSFFELQNPEDGTYDFKITARDRRGVQSNPLIGRYEMDGSNLPQSIVTRRYPDTDIDNVPVGSIYFNEENQPFRREAGELYFGEEQLLFNGDPIVFNGYVDVQDKSLLAAIEALQSVDDDGRITIDEKIRIVIPREGELQAAYDAIVAQATTLGISTPAGVVAANAAWIALRDSLSPAWNDTTQETLISRDDWDSTLNTYRVELEAAKAELGEPGAVSVSAPPAQQILRDSTGDPKPGEFPRTLQPIVYLGATDITLSDVVDYSITTSNVDATIDNTDSSPTKGEITVTDGGAGFIDLSVSVNGIAQPPQRIQFTTSDDSNALQVSAGSITFTDGTTTRIKKWGTATGLPGTYSFPTPFPTACESVVYSLRGDIGQSDEADEIHWVSGVSASGFTISIDGDYSSFPNVYYEAWGY